ncbi:MAG: hypothetical protein PHF05_08120, partial [Candidatus Izemoplasmatales bacterium]|nr:hypothetical protein [Candidatus Izemoplasmatales bacterium]
MKNNLITLIRYLCRKLVSSFISLSRKVVPYVMVIAFVFTAPDFSFLRKYIRNQIETVFNLDENTDLIDMKNAYEVTELRTENSKTFKKDNDSFEMVLYSDDVHYLTDNGSFLEIDNNLTKSGSAYKNNANRYSVEFPDLINSSKTKISYKDNHLEWKFNFSLNSKAQSKNNLIRYENVTEDIDIEYLVLNDRIKENLIVKKYIEDFSFSYSIFTELKLVREDNVINLFNKDNELIFTINDYYMFDSNENYSYDLKTTITEIKTNEYLITVTPDNQYLQKAAYPLTIDPEIIINYVSESGNIEYKLFDEDGMHDEGFTELMLSTTRICSICGGDGYYTGYEMCTICNGRGYTVGPDRELILCPYCSRGQIPVEKVCTNCIGIIDPTTLFYKLNFFASPALRNLKNCNFLYAYTNFHTNSTKGNGVVNARKLSESDWQRNDLTGYTSSGDIISSVRFNNNSSFTHQFDLYDYFFENINKFGTNFSLCFELDIEAGTNSYVEYDSPGLSSVEVVIGYSNEAGLQDYYTYEEVVSSNSATSYVAHNSGNLISIFSDYSDNNLINLAHVYNSNRNHLLSSYGYGFSLNFDESITEVTPTILKLTKGDKSTVDFILQDGEYIAKDGSGERITIHDSGKYSLLTRDNQLKVYNLNKKLAIIYPDADDITDSVEISYNSSNNIAYIQNFIIDPLNLTSYIRTYAQFNYNYNLLTSIVFSRADENKVLQPVEKISYEYTIYNLTKIKKYCYNTNTTYEICNFTYLPKSITIQDNITNGVKFSFDDANRVKKINALIPNVAEENSPSLDFSFDKQGRRLSISDSEDYQVIYTFDSYFRTKSVMDSLGYTTFTEYKDIFFPGGVYTTDPKYDQNHKVISSSVPFNNTYNLVNNHSFELGDSPLYWTGSNQMIVKEFLYLYGKRALCITSSSTSGASSYQNLKVKAGRTYTVTGYIKNENDSGEGAYIDVTSNYITIDSRSESIKDSDNYHLYSLTFTANSDATVTLRLWNKSIGNAYFDAIQVNDSSVNTRYNYLQNSSFEYSSGWNNSPDYINNDVFDISLMGDKCAKIRNKTITQTIDISGEAGDVLIFGGFAYLENVNARGKIRLKIKYQDETEVFEFTYDPSDANIQYLMKKAEAEYDYTQITLEIENSSTYDYLYLDNLAIYIEGYGLEIE